MSLATLREALPFARTMLRLRPGPGQLANLARFGWEFFLRGRRPNVVKRYRPLSVGLYINQICNLKCEFCYLNWDDAAVPREDMTLDQADKMLDHPSCRRAVRLFVGGGEPLLHRGYFDFVARGTRRRMYTVTHSNGLLVNRRLKELAASTLSCLNISLYDDFIDKQLENAALLLRENKRTGNPMRVTLARIANSENFRRMGETIERAIGIGARHLFFQNHFPASWPSGHIDSGALHLPLRADSAEYAAQVAELKRKYEGRIRISWPPLLMEKAVKGDSCLSLFSVINFDQRGQISPCCFIAPPMPHFGSINEEDPWNNGFYRELRTSIVRPDAALGPSCGVCSLRSNGLVKFF